MNDFYDFIAERKHALFHSLYIAKPQAYTNDECFDRIENKAKYDEIHLLINFLPLEGQKKVQQRFKELKG